jgi:Amt family ammonium transporter
LIGVAAVGGFVVVASAASWYLIKATMGLRVSREEEMEGLDIGEHGSSAYPDFQLKGSYSAAGLETGRPARQFVPARQTATNELS